MEEAHKRSGLKEQLESSQNSEGKTMKEWLELDDDEIHQAFCHVEYETNNDWNNDPEGWCKAFYRYVDAKLKEKNHG